MPSKTYKLLGTYWRQKELTFSDDKKIKQLISPLESFLKTKPNISEIIDKAFEMNIVNEIFSMVMTPYEPTFVHRWINERRGKSFHMKAGELLEVLSNSEAARVIADFFIINTSWIPNLQDFATALDLEQLKSLRKMMPMIADLKRSALNSSSSQPAKEM